MTSESGFFVPLRQRQRRAQAALSRLRSPCGDCTTGHLPTRFRPYRSRFPRDGARALGGRGQAPPHFGTRLSWSAGSPNTTGTGKTTISASSSTTLFRVLVAGAIEQAVFVGTSRGGLLTMALAAARPATIRGVVFNDVGPVIDARGLLRIRGYVGKLPVPRSFQEGAEIRNRLSDQQFPILGEAEWEMMARRTWTDRDGALKPDYDIKLMKVLEELDLEAPLPVLWPYFDALKTVPLLAIRGANSTFWQRRPWRRWRSAIPIAKLHCAGPGPRTAARQQGHDPADHQADRAGRAPRRLIRLRTSCGLTRAFVLDDRGDIALSGRPVVARAFDLSCFGSFGEFRLGSRRQKHRLPHPVLALDAAGKGR